MLGKRTLWNTIRKTFPIETKIAKAATAVDSEAETEADSEAEAEAEVSSNQTSNLVYCSSPEEEGLLCQLA